jgi:superfamily II DNA or RNA helicase
LVTQTAKRLRQEFGVSAVGEIMPGAPPNRSARVQVGTVQTLIARSSRPPADLVVLDEAHHYMAAEWRGLAEEYPEALCLGLTATPARQDGEPLGDIFDAIVVAASYSELIDGGFLVPACVYQPPDPLGNDLAQDPFDAWVKYAAGIRSFVFCARVSGAYETAQRFRDHGVNAQTIEANSAMRFRKETIVDFRADRVKVITNVNTMTEGIDVPDAGCAVLARAFGHVGSYLQAVGRVLRPARGKRRAIVIDLPGMSLCHGLPDQDREYSLRGRAISGGAARYGATADRAAFQQEVLGVELVPTGRAATSAWLREELKENPNVHLAAVRYRDTFGGWPSASQLRDLCSG